MIFFDFILDLLSSKKCYSCNKEWRFLCDDCFHKEYDYLSSCYICKWSSNNYLVHDKCKNGIFFDKTIILKHYNSKIIKKLIKDSKFYWLKNIFKEFSNYLYIKFLLNHKIVKKDEYLIIPIPSNFLRKIKRWYNSSEELCLNFSKISWIKYSKNIVNKVKNTRQQSKLSKKDRIINLKSCFKINKKQIDKLDNKKVIIIDDVISTWTTINELSRILKENWAKEIIWLIIASD